MTKAEEKERDALALVRDEMREWRERHVWDGLRTADLKLLIKLIDRLDEREKRRAWRDMAGRPRIETENPHSC